MAAAGSIFVDLLLRDTQFVSGTRKARKELSGLESSGKALGTAFKAAGVAAAAFGLTISASKIIAINDSFTTMESRLKLVTGSADNAAIALDRLYNVAQDNRQPFNESIDGYIRLSQSLTAYQRQQYDVIGLSNILSQTLRVSGTDAAGAATFFQQFGQAATSDFKAIGQELQTFADQNPVFYGLIRDEVSKTGENLKKFAADGKLSFDFIAKVLTDNAATIAQQSQGMSLTVSQAGTVLSNAFDNYIRTSPDVDTASQLIAKAILIVADAFDTAEKKGINFTNLLAGLGGIFTKLELSAASAGLELQKFIGDEEAIKKQQAYVDRLSTSYNKLLDAILDSREQGAEGGTSGGGENPIKPPTPPALGGGISTIEKTLRALEDENRQLAVRIDMYGQSESAIDAFIRKQEIYTELQREGVKLTANQKEQLDAYLASVEKQNLELERLKENSAAYKEYIEEIEKEQQKQAEKYEQYAKRAAENIQDAFADFLFDPFQDGLDGMLKGFVDLLRRMAAEATAAQILGDSKTGLLSTVLGGIGSLFGAGTNVYGNQPVGPFPAGYVGGFADGGFIPAGKWGVVGENGMEVAFGGNVGKTIMNQEQLSGLSKGNNYYIDATGADQAAIARLEGALLSLAGKGVIERRVANAQKRGGL